MKVITLVFDCYLGEHVRMLDWDLISEIPLEDFDYDDYHIKFSYFPKSNFGICFGDDSYEQLIHGELKVIGEMGDLRVVEGKFQGNPKPVVQFELLDNTDVEEFLNSCSGIVETPNLNPDPDEPKYLECIRWYGEPTILRDV